MGYQFKEGKRFQFYLTNTLEMKDPKQISFLIDLAKEGQEAKRIKEKVPILVVLGNPPYSVSSENKSEFIENLMDDYKEDVREERNIQPLSDDYIKFIRFAHWKITQAGKGILGFITNNSYLSGVIHRGMRRKLFETFDEIYILNLHGSSRIGEKTPEGSKDENVFDIQQGVAIALFVKLEKSLKEKTVHYTDLWGLREEKYKYLFGKDVQTTKWLKLEPFAPYWFFVPKDFALQAEYEKFWKVTEVFREWASGVKTNRDNFLVDFDKPVLTRRILDMISKNLNDELFKVTYELKDGKYWNTKREREKVRSNPNYKTQFLPYLYRPFDVRWIFYQPNLIEIGRGGASKDLMRHFVQGDNLGLGVKRSRYMKVFEFRHVFVTTATSDVNFFGDQSIFFPLYLCTNESEGEIHELPLRRESKMRRTPNFNSEFLSAMRTSLGKEPAPEEIFHYIYALLYSPTYRKRYEEFLKIDFPRVPLPSNYEVFKELGGLGKELVDLHLLKHPDLEKTDVGFPKSGSNKVEKVAYVEEGQRVFINKEQYFEGIPKEVWEYRIGAYQVMEKYLKDRKGRKLSLDEINLYMKVAKAILLTIALQEKIDTVYAKAEN
jgi:predicted helicase